MIKLEKYDEKYLNFSWDWLNDPEIKFLTNTSDFSREEQIAWFNNIDKKLDYKIWGVSFNDTPIGVFGIKNINFRKGIGEYWGYIGDKKFWGKGLGTLILEKILKVASEELLLKSISLKVLKTNIIAFNLYKKFNFEEIGNDDVIIKMIKIL